MIGRNLAHTYELPQEQPLQGQQAPANYDPAAMMPELGSDLQHKEGVTREYYQKYSNIQALARTMWSNFKIDITKPDIQNPHAMQMHELYQKAVGDLMTTGDRLKGERKTQMMMDQARAQGLMGYTEEYDRNNQYASEVLDNYAYSTKVGDPVEQANRYNATVSRTEGEQGTKNASQEALIADLEQRMAKAKTPGQRKELEIQRDAVQKSALSPYDNSVGWANLALRREQLQEEDNKKKKPYTGLIKTFHNLALGRDASFKEGRTMNDTGDAFMLESDAMGGASIGMFEEPKYDKKGNPDGTVQKVNKIEKILHDPISDKTYIKTTSGEKLELNEGTVAALMRRYVDGNSGDGYKLQELEDFINEGGFIGDDGSMDLTEFITDDKNTNNYSELSTKVKDKATKKTAALKTKIAGLKDGTGFDITGHDGSTVKISSTGWFSDEYQIKYTAPGQKAVVNKFDSADEVELWLKKNNFVADLEDVEGVNPGGKPIF